MNCILTSFRSAVTHGLWLGVLDMSSALRNGTILFSFFQASINLHLDRLDLLGRHQDVVYFPFHTRISITHNKDADLSLHGRLLELDPRSALKIPTLPAVI